MSAIIEQKKQIVDEISTKFRESKSTIVVDYRGLTVSEVTELRKQLREAGIDFKVYKNTMTRRAVEQVARGELRLWWFVLVCFTREGRRAPPPRGAALRCKAVTPDYKLLAGLDSCTCTQVTVT